MRVRTRAWIAGEVLESMFGEVGGEAGLLFKVSPRLYGVLWNVLMSERGERVQVSDCKWEGRKV